MKHFKYAIAVLGATAFFALPVLADKSEAKDCDHHKHQEAGAGEPHEEGMRGGMGHMNQPPFDKILSLTDAQKKTLEDARLKQEPAMRDLHEKMKAAHDALEKAGESNADDATITKLANETSLLIAQQEVARIKMHRQLVSILTSEQKQKLADFEAEHKKMRHDHGVNHDGGKPKV